VEGMADGGSRGPGSVSPLVSGGGGSVLSTLDFGDPEGLDVGGVCRLGVGKLSGTCSLRADRDSLGSFVSFSSVSFVGMGGCESKAYGSSLDSEETFERRVGSKAVG
jgi:hypothetical protein